MPHYFIFIHFVQIEVFLSQVVFLVLLPAILLFFESLCWSYVFVDEK